MGLMLMSGSLIRCFWPDRSLPPPLSRGVGMLIEGTARSLEVVMNPGLVSTGEAIGDGRG